MGRVQGQGNCRRGRALAATLALTLALSGCGLDPVGWIRDLSGGPPPVDRPPPPQADMPYANLATVPPKPQMPDAATRQKLADSLLADRANAKYAAAQAPLADPSSPTASPALFGGSAPPPPPPGQTSSPPQQTSSPSQQAPAASQATLAAATAPPPAKAPAPAKPPSPAPRTAVAEAALPPPTMPDQPPAPPQIPGSPVAPTTPAPPPVAPKVASGPAKLAANQAAPLAIAFPPTSAVLPDTEKAALTALAKRRAGHGILVIGYGEAETDTPEAQQAALRLALERARAVSVALGALGVPPNAIRMDAQPSGRGAAARLLD